MLQEALELYGKLMHACAAVRRGKAYLMNLERTITVLQKKPCLPQHPDKSLEQDLIWWSSLLQSGGVSQPIHPPATFSIPLTYSHASLGISIGIVINNKWRAWRLVPGWQTADGGKWDITWAEAISFELLVHTLASLSHVGENIIIYGDNMSIIEGWWRGSHRNRAVDEVSKWIHEFTHSLFRPLKICTEYVTSKSNLADEPSRGIYGEKHLLLPPTIFLMKSDASSLMQRILSPPQSSTYSVMGSTLLLQPSHQ
jgi:hypothetical protein